MSEWEKSDAGEIVAWTSANEARERAPGFYGRQEFVLDRECIDTLLSGGAVWLNINSSEYAALITSCRGVSEEEG
jgi:hypothetical protein